MAHLITVVRLVPAAPRSGLVGVLVGVGGMALLGPLPFTEDALLVPHVEALSVDWSRAVELLNQLVLNLKQDQPFTDVLTHQVPTAGALLVGVLRGFKRS